MKLYTCDNGKWLYEKGSSFGAWREQDRSSYDVVMDEVYEFEVSDSEEYKTINDFTEYPVYVNSTTEINSFNKIL